jgi:hypothetical protein
MLRRNMTVHDSPTKTMPLKLMHSFDHQVYPDSTVPAKSYCKTTQGL